MSTSWVTQMLELFRFEFGYGWLYNYGHLVPVLLFTGTLVAARRFEWPRWVTGAAATGLVWAMVGLLIVQFVLRMNLPMALPTENFLPEGVGTVLDGGAGSGRSSIMVLRSRPETSVVAVDLYEGSFGIQSNGPERLMQNARRAGLADRVSVEVGDLRELPLADASLDGAVSAFVIDHLRRDGREQALAEIRRVLRADAQFLLVVVHPDLWIRTAWPFFMHHGYWGSRSSQDRWHREVTEAGFEVDEVSTAPGSLYVLARKPAERPDTALTSLAATESVPGDPPETPAEGAR